MPDREEIRQAQLKEIPPYVKALNYYGKMLLLQKSMDEFFEKIELTVNHTLGTVTTISADDHTEELFAELALIIQHYRSLESKDSDLKVDGIGFFLDSYHATVTVAKFKDEPVHVSHLLYLWVEKDLLAIERMPRPHLN